MIDFNPRSPRGERHIYLDTYYFFVPFQSTLPARGATRGDVRVACYHPLFQSTLPARGATGRFDYYWPVFAFQSTLPARGATWETCAYTARYVIFQSTLPARGATYALIINEWFRDEFQSTLPARGATLRPESFGLDTLISIHAPREGSDAMLLRSGEAGLVISIHAPREGSDGILSAPTTTTQ